MNLIDTDTDFKNLCQDMEEIYKCALNEGFRFEADSFVGFSGGFKRRECDSRNQARQRTEYLL